MSEVSPYAPDAPVDAVDVAEPALAPDGRLAVEGEGITELGVHVAVLSSVEMGFTVMSTMS